MSRTAVDTRLGVSLLRPVASPVDTYVDPGPGNLRGLADSLRSLNADLGSLLDKRDKKKLDEDRLKGEAEFYKNNNEGYAEAVRRGVIPAQNSKGFVQGWKGAEGLVSGNDLKLRFVDAFNKWDGKNSDDPQAYDKFVAGWLSENISTSDPDVLRTLLPQVRDLHDTGRALYTDYKSKQVYGASVQAHAAGISQDIDKATSEGLSEPSGTDYGTLATRIEDWRASFLAAGGRIEDADKMVIEAVAAKATQLQDDKLLDMLKEKVPGQDYTYLDTPYGLQVVTQTRDALDVIKRRAASEAWTAQEREAKARGDRARSQIQEFLATNPGAPIPQSLMDEAKRYDDTIITKVAEWRQTLNRGFTDEKALRAVYDDILKGGGMEAVTKANEQKVFGRTEDLKAAVDFARSFEDNKEEIEDALKSDNAQTFLKAFATRTTGKNDYGDPISGLSNEGFEAQYDFNQAVKAWIVANPNADYLAREEAITKIGKTILDRITVTDPMSVDPGAYMRDPAAVAEAAGRAFENPYTGGITLGEPKPDTAPAAEPAPAGGGPAAAPTGSAGPAEPPPAKVKDVDGAAKEIIDGLNPEQAKAFADRAASYGMTPEEFAKATVTGAELPVAKSILDNAKDGAQSPEPWFEVPSIGLKVGPYVGPGSKWWGADQQGSGAAPEGGGGPGGGAGALVSSSKRGHAPDLKNLRPEIVRGVGALQSAWGKDLPIVSGYRDARRNAKAGGAKHSQHTHGNAVDIDVSDMPVQEQVRLIKLASSQGFTGIGVYGGSIHLDYGGRRAWGPTFRAASIPAWAKEAINEHLAGNTPSPTMRKPGQPFTLEMARSLLQQALDADPTDLEWPGSANIPGDGRASQLANFVRQHEAGGNYNAVYGKSGSTVDLGQFSLNQVLAMQQGAKLRGAKSTAIGGYQFLHATLRGLKEELGLTGKERFTPQLQDRLFYALLLKRGWRQFQAGKIGMKTMALRLSQEWAALPNPETGRSYYAGDGLNASRTRTAQVYALLGI